MNRRIICMMLLLLITEHTDAAARAGGDEPASAISTSRRWMKSVLENDIVTLRSLSGLPFANNAFCNTSNNNRPCPPTAVDERTFSILAKCMFADERYAASMLSQGSTWRTVSIKMVERRFSDLSPSGTFPDLRAFRSNKNIVIIEGRAKKFEGAVGIYLAIHMNDKIPQVVAAVEFGDIQVDAGSGE